MQTNVSFESLSTAYFTAHDCHTFPPPSESHYRTAGSCFYTIGGNVVNVAGDYCTTTLGPTVTYPPDHANHAPTGAITRHFVGRADELLQIQCAFDSPRDASRPVRFAEGWRTVQPSDYVCAESMETHEARRWLEDAHPAIAWLLVVDSAALDSVNYLRTHLPRRNQGGDILFVAQSEVVAKALAAEGHGTVLEVGPLAQDDATQLFLEKAGVEGRAELWEEARSIVERLDHLPIPIRQAASFAKHHQGNLGCLTRLLQERRGTVLSRWETRLTGYEYTTFESIVQAQFDKLTSDRPQAAELLKVLCYLHPHGISLPILVDGARLLLSPPTKTSKLSQFMAQFVRPPLSPSDLCHPLRALLSAISVQVELHNLVRCLQHISLVRMETIRPTNGGRNAEPLTGRSLRIPDLVRKIVRGSIVQMAAESAYHDMAVQIVVSAFMPHKHDPSLWNPFIKHIASLSRWDLLLRVPRGRLSLTERALFRATQIIIDFHKKVGLEGKLNIMKLEFDRDIKLVLHLRGLHNLRQLKQAFPKV